MCFSPFLLPIYKEFPFLFTATLIPRLLAAVDGSGPRGCGLGNGNLLPPLPEFYAVPSDVDPRTRPRVIFFGNEGSHQDLWYRICCTSLVSSSEFSPLLQPRPFFFRTFLEESFLLSGLLKSYPRARRSVGPCLSSSSRKKFSFFSNRL